MARANKGRSLAHARIYEWWTDLPAWRALSGRAVKLLTAMMVENRPGRNGLTDWTAERAGRAVDSHKATGARLLSELVDKGWLVVVRQGEFGTKSRPSRYALAMFPNDATGEPEALGFRDWEPHRPMAKPDAVASLRLNGSTTATGQSRHCDANGSAALPDSGHRP